MFTTLRSRLARRFLKEFLQPLEKQLLFVAYFLVSESFDESLRVRQLVSRRQAARNCGREQLPLLVPFETTRLKLVDFRQDSSRHDFACHEQFAKYIVTAARIP